MKTLFYFTVQTGQSDEDGEISMLFCGGPIKPSDKPNRVWLTRPTGEKLLEVDRDKVHPLTKEQYEKYWIDEVKLQKSKAN